MSETTFTQTQAEDAITGAASFLHTERGVDLDGSFASQQITERVESVGDRAQKILQSRPIPGKDGWFVPLSKSSAPLFDEAAITLPGHIVLIPSAMVEKGSNAFYPAVVSEDGNQGPISTIRLHVLKQPYFENSGIEYGASMVLSAAGQSETKGIGDHGRVSNDGVEAEHFATLLAAGSDEGVQAAWKSGQHINHAWRKSSSVISEVSRRLFGNDIPQTTITITRKQVEDGQAGLFWHSGMSDELTNAPETATRQNALVVMQGMGFVALAKNNPLGIDAVKELIA